MDTPNLPPQPGSPPPQPAPSSPPAPLPPLGRTFVITLLAPFVPILICFIVGLAGGRAVAKSGVGLIFFFVSLPVMLGCSIACSIQVGARKGAGLGILTFIGTQILYLSAAFAGCVASFSGMDFK